MKNVLMQEIKNAAEAILVKNFGETHVRITDIQVIFELGQNFLPGGGDINKSTLSGQPVPAAAEPRKKRRSKNALIAAPGTISDEDVVRMRRVLAVKKKFGRLDENQVSALKSTEGIRVCSLTDVQRQQIKDIFESFEKV